MHDFFERHADKIVAVSESGCWIWVGAAMTAGYGMVKCGHRLASGVKAYRSAHRLAFEASFGPIPGGSCVLHRCDVPSCVNPTHLRLGTQAENMKDMAAKRRSCIGEKHRAAKLTAVQVGVIRFLANRGSSFSDLARAYGVNPQSISNIVNRRTWRHVA
jgi:hypothetical protein